MTGTPQPLHTRRLADVTPFHAERVTGPTALPLWSGLLHAVVGEGESGKTWLAAHAALDAASRGVPVLVVDGEMAAGAWATRMRALGADDNALTAVHWTEMTQDAAATDRVRATWQQLGARIVVWDSALAMLSRTARSENDNAEVSRVYDRLRDIVRDGPAGLIVDHTARGATALISRGASAKFNALDISYGIRLADGSTPGTADAWTSVVSVEKDRHAVIGNRLDRHATFHPLAAGALVIDLAETATSSNRLTSDDSVKAAVTAIEALTPPPTSANDAAKRIAFRRQTVQAAYKIWSSQ